MDEQKIAIFLTYKITTNVKTDTNLSSLGADKLNMWRIALIKVYFQMHKVSVGFAFGKFKRFMYSQGSIRCLQMPTPLQTFPCGEISYNAFETK